MKAKKDP